MLCLCVVLVRCRVPDEKANELRLDPRVLKVVENRVVTNLSKELLIETLQVPLLILLYIHNLCIISSHSIVLAECKSFSTAAMCGMRVCTQLLKGSSSQYVTASK
jgi:hypothetical protein